MLDIVVIVIILVCVAIGYRRGIIESALRLSAFFIAILFSRNLHSFVADFLAGTSFYDLVYDWLFQYIFFGAGLVTSLVLNLVSVILLLFFFTVVLNIVLTLLRVINFVPIVGGINRGLGAIAGLFSGFLIVWGITIVYQLFFDTYTLDAFPFTAWLANNNMVLGILDSFS